METNSSFMASASCSSALEHAGQLVAGLGGRAAADLGQPLQFGADDAFKLPAVDTDFLQEGPHDAVVFVEEGLQEVQRLDLRMALLGRQRLCRSDRFLTFDR